MLLLQPRLQALFLSLSWPSYELLLLSTGASVATGVSIVCPLQMAQLPIPPGRLGWPVVRLLYHLWISQLVKEGFQMRLTGSLVLQWCRAIHRAVDKERHPQLRLFRSFAFSVVSLISRKCFPIALSGSDSFQVGPSLLQKPFVLPVLWQNDWICSKRAVKIVC